MNLQSAKLAVVQKILAVETESVINKISKILDKAIIVGYTAEGKPLGKEAYNARLTEGIEQIRNGRFTTQEDLEKESETW